MELASGQDQLTSEGIYTVEKIRQILAETISSSAKSAGNAWLDVYKRQPALKAIKNVPTKKTITKGKTYTLKPQLYPSGAIAKITYTTSNKSIATVDSKGKITAKKKGTAVITVKAGKFTAKCKVTVK